MNKPREFWINYDGWGGVKVTYFKEQSREDAVHVIEHSAYTAFEEKLEEARKVIEFYSASENYDSGSGPVINTTFDGEDFEHQSIAIAYDRGAYARAFLEKWGKG